MELKDLILKSPTVTRDTPISVLLEQMSKTKTDLIPVVENEKLVGVVSEKDLLKLIKAQPIAGMAAMLIKDMPTDSRRVVAEIMTSHPITISSSASIADALKVMAANNLKRLIVVDSGKLVGIVRAADLFRKIFGK